jgi:hypothetical protein
LIARPAISLVLCAFAAGASAAGSAACTVETRAVTSTVPLADCALTHLYAPDGEERLGAAENLWQGYVLQTLHQSQGCGVGELHVVVDCADGTAWSFAPGGPALKTGAELDAAKAEGAYEQLSRYVRKSPRGYGAVAGWRRADELTLVDLGSVLGQRIALGTQGETYDLGCGCKLHNPGSPGAW